MDAWLSYRLGDLLMFTPEVYFRLFERYNAALWPLQLLALVLALWFVVAARSAGPVHSRLLVVTLAAHWLLIAWAFFLRFYAEIFLAASWFAALFALQGVLLAAFGMLGRLRFDGQAGVAGRVGLLLLIYAVFVHPLVGLLAGREWRGAELFLLAPDATALGTLALLLMLRGPGSRWLLTLPFVWCLISGATYLAMESHAGLATPVAAAVALLAALPGGLRSRRAA